MPTLYQLKPAFQNLLRPLCRGLVGAGVTANQVTLAAAALSVATGALIAWRPGARWVLLLVPAVLFVRMALNALDGMMAREHGQKTPLGAVLNELGDVVADAALYLPFALVPGFRPALVVTVVVFAVIGEMTGVIGVQIGASRRYDGPAGKSDRAFAFGGLALLAGLGVPPGVWIDVVLGALAVLSGLTIANRARAAVREAGRGTGGGPGA